MQKLHAGGAVVKWLVFMVVCVATAILVSATLDRGHEATASLNMPIAKAALAGDVAGSAGKSCFKTVARLDDRDREIASVAWGYFERNTQAATGLVNSVDGYPAATMWDIASSLAAFITAADLQLTDRASAKQSISLLLNTLETIDLFNDEAPNKVYHTATAQMVDYRNRPAARGIGVSMLDLGRLASWMNILACEYPEYRQQLVQIVQRWNFCRLLDKGQMYGLALDNKDNVLVLQEGRLGYEQYAARGFTRLGFTLPVSDSYSNRHATAVKIEGVAVAVDRRDAAALGAHNFVVTDSYAMEAVEHGIDERNQQLIDNIFLVQQKRFENTGRLTAVTEDNIDRAPYFIYNTVFSDKRPWFALTERGEDMEALKTLSTKAAISLAYLKPGHWYSEKLLAGIWQARNPRGGWYSGIYEATGEMNKATTANTNGLILSLVLNKKYGALGRSRSGYLQLDAEFLQRADAGNECKAQLPVLTAGAKLAATQRAIRWANEAAQRKIDSIDAIATQLQKAQQKHQAGDLDGALAVLSKAKSASWSASDALDNTGKKKMRVLMGSYDRVKGAWQQSKDASESVLKITTVLANVRQRLAPGKPVTTAINDSAD